jgi:hypothetical protein
LGTRPNEGQTQEKGGSEAEAAHSGLRSQDSATGLPIPGGEPQRARECLVMPGAGLKVECVGSVVPE